MKDSQVARREAPPDDVDSVRRPPTGSPRPRAKTTLAAFDESEGLILLRVRHVPRDVWMRARVLAIRRGVLVADVLDEALRELPEDAKIERHGSDDVVAKIPHVSEELAREVKARAALARVRLGDVVGEALARWNARVEEPAAPATQDAPGTALGDEGREGP